MRPNRNVYSSLMKGVQYGWSKWAGPFTWNILCEIIVALRVSMRKQLNV